MPMRVTFSTDGSSSDEVFYKPHHGTQMPLGAVHPNNPGNEERSVFPWIASLALAMTSLSSALMVTGTAVTIDGAPLMLS